MNYLARTEYEAIARQVEPNVYLPEAVHLLMEAHRTLAFGFIKDSELTPRELSLVTALRAHLKSTFEVKAVLDIAKVEDVPADEVQVVELPTPPTKRKKS